jgi:NodT family efflux transporter outer membrane factor (OMF) lipoprotein
MGKGTPPQQYIHYRRATTVACMLLGVASVVPLADCQSIQTQVSGTHDWSTTLAGGEILGPVDEAALSQWWTVFNDPILTSLEERALKSNLDLRTALSNIEQARANRLSASGSSLPSVTVMGSSTGNRSSNWLTAANSSGGSLTAANSAGGSLTAANSAELQASWEPDFFGAIRKNVASHDASIQAAQEGLRNTMVTLTAELATDYINLRSYQAQLAVTQSNLVKYRETYEMTLEKRRSGLAADLDVAQALETVQSTEATVPVLETSLQQTMNAMAILLALRPGALDTELAEPKPIPVVSADVAVGIPADLLRRRPDVKQAERQVAAQSLQLGVAKANLYPTFSLSATFLTSVENLLNVFSPAGIGSAVAGSVEQTILNRRALHAQVKLQNALLDQYEVAYDSTLLGAVKDVENSLYAFGKDQVKRKSLADAADSAEQAAEMSRELYASGKEGFLTVEDSERNVLSAQNSLVQANATVDTDLIAIYKAMGGGWK